MPTTSDEPTTPVFERVLAILDELPAIGKDQRNQQQGFMFRGHDDILNALNPLLAKHGVFVVPDVIERIVAQRQTQRGGVMYEVNLHVAFRFYGVDGDHVEASTWGEGTDTGDKATNKAMTMAFKNVLNQTFAISSAEFKDADGETPEETRGRQGSSEPEADQDARTVSGSEGSKSAEETPVTSGQINQIKTVLELLDTGFPEHPGEGRTWADVLREHRLRLWPDKPDMRQLSVADGNQLFDWLEDQHRMAVQDAQVPFG